MPFYKDFIYPYLVDILGDPPPILKIRQQIIPQAQGKVLEIGVGSGANFIHYNPASVSRLYALEPNPGMIRLAERQRPKTRLNVEFIDLPGEPIPLDDDSIDTVVSTFTLCTIPGIADAIRGIARVLKPTASSSSLNSGSRLILKYNAGKNNWNQFTTGCFKVYI